MVQKYPVKISEALQKNDIMKLAGEWAEVKNVT